MKKIFALSSLLLVLAAPAFAGLDLGWNDCSTSGGLANTAMDCDGSVNGTFSNSAYGNFQAANAMAQFIAMDFVIDVQTTTDPLPDFWRFGAAGCNNGNLTLDDARLAKCLAGTTAQPTPCFATGAQCLNGSAWASEFGGTNRARFVGSIFRDATQPVALAAGTNYFCLTFTIYTFNASEAGGACSGCTDPAAIVFNSLKLSGLSAGVGTEEQVEDISGNGMGPNGACIGANGGDGLCGATPTQARTWGQVKSLYR